MSQEQILLLFAAGFLAVVGYGISRLFVRRGGSQVEERLRDALPDEPAAADPSAPGRVSALLDRVGRTVGKPFAPHSDEERSKLNQQLGYAGIYSASAVHLMAGAKALALAGGLLAGYLLGIRFFRQPLLGLAVGGLGGYLLPTFWLDALVRRQRRALEHALPDALDLMVVCVEAGLTVDAAMQRVGREINLAHPSLARELAITHMQSQMGLPRPDAMRSLSRRTGSAALQSLTAMLIQAERFGTSIAQALRIHAESLRVKRQYAAEEMASKSSVKIMFPLVLCIFPSLLIVLGGPAMIKIMQSGIMSR